MTSTIVRPRGPRRTALDVPLPESGKHYLWADGRASHPQGYARFKTDGYVCTPAGDADKIGLSGYVDEDGIEVVKDSANVIRYGQSVLMECSDENFYRIKGEKMGQYDAFDGTVEAEAEANIAGVQEEYKRRKRGG